MIVGPNIDIKKVIAQADLDARFAVCGSVHNAKTHRSEPASGDAWSDRFIEHPLVREAVADHWDQMLKNWLIHAIKGRIMRGESWSDVDSLMPPDQAPSSREVSPLAYFRGRGKAYKAAAEWRAEAVAKYGSMPKALEAMQRKGKGKAA